MLLHRILTAVVGIPAALLLIYLGGWYFAGAVALIAVGGLRELYRLFARRERHTYPWLGYPLAIALTALAAMTPRGVTVLSPWLEGALLLGAFAIAASWMLSSAVPPIGSRLFATISAHIYVPQLLSYLVRLRSISLPDITPHGLSKGLPAGACLVVLLMVVIWGMDTAAYAVGKTMGRHKLCPGISPGKTVEGALAALAAAAALSAAFGYWLRLPLAHVVILGAAIGVIGQLGDLFESMLKRRAGVKDSGSTLPGHGGVLDRFDSLLFAAPLAFFYLTFAAAGSPPHRQPLDQIPRQSRSLHLLLGGLDVVSHPPDLDDAILHPPDAEARRRVAVSRLADGARVDEVANAFLQLHRAARPQRYLLGESAGRRTAARSVVLADMGVADERQVPGHRVEADPRFIGRGDVVHLIGERAVHHHRAIGVRGQRQGTQVVLLLGGQARRRPFQRRPGERVEPLQVIAADGGEVVVPGHADQPGKLAHARETSPWVRPIAHQIAHAEEAVNPAKLVEHGLEGLQIGVDVGNQAVGHRATGQLALCARRFRQRYSRNGRCHCQANPRRPPGAAGPPQNLSSVPCVK
jgi:phosphatidate cytidylyltransferase